MIENSDQDLTVDVLAASLSLEQQDAGNFLQLLARKFAGGLPRNTQVKRGLLGLGAVQSVTLCFEDCQYEISKNKYGSIEAKSIEVVRGIKIKTTTISTTEWIEQVATTLAQQATKNAEIRASLNQFIVG
jgi:hypothetical protein